MQHMGTHAATPRAHTSWSPAPPRLPRLTDAASAAPSQNSEQERLRRFARGLAPYLLCSKKRRCHGHGGAARGLPLPGAKGERRGRAAHAPGALARNHLQALHWRLVAYLNCPCPASSPPHQRVCFLSRALCPLSRISLLGREAHLLCGSSFVARACVPSVRRNVRTGTAP